MAVEVIEDRRLEEDPRLVRFMQEYLPSHVPGTRSGIGRMMVIRFTEALLDDFMEAHGRENYPKFRDELLGELREMAKVAHYLEPRMGENAQRFVQNFFKFNLKGTKFEEKLGNCWLNARFAAKWLKLRPEAIGEFKIVPSSLSHVESILSLEVRRPDGEPVASMGFIVCRRGKGHAVRITNVQGTKYAGFALKRLSSAFGENWRVSLVRRFAERSLGKKIEVEGQMPLKFSITPEREHKRLARQYRQTYRKAGFAPSENGKVWRFAGRRPKA